MGKACGKQNLRPWLDSSPLNMRGNALYILLIPAAATPCISSPVNSPVFLPPLQKCEYFYWCSILVGEKCAMNCSYLTKHPVLQSHKQLWMMSTHPEPAIRNGHQQPMALARSILTCSWLLQAQSSLHFAVMTWKSSHLAEFNLHPLAVKAVTSFWHPIQAG